MSGCHLPIRGNKFKCSKQTQKRSQAKKKITLNMTRQSFARTIFTIWPINRRTKCKFLTVQIFENSTKILDHLHGLILEPLS